MNKTLIVMRHAKSSWDHHGPDKTRPLNERGRKSANALGDWLRAQHLEPDTILCSSAARTQETALRLKLKTPITAIDALYMASAEELLSEVKIAQGNTILLLAHNPGIGDFAERLAIKAPKHPRFMDYPSGATTVFDCSNADWHELGFAQASTTLFITPRELF